MTQKNLSEITGESLRNIKRYWKEIIAPEPLSVVTAEETVVIKASSVVTNPISAGDAESAQLKSEKTLVITSVTDKSELENFVDRLKTKLGYQITKVITATQVLVRKADGIVFECSVVDLQQALKNVA